MRGGALGKGREAVDRIGVPGNWDADGLYGFRNGRKRYSGLAMDGGAEHREGRE